MNQKVFLKKLEMLSKKSDRNIVQTLADENYTTLVKLINVAGLEKILAEGGPFTVFAPTNKAFNALPAATVQALMNNTTELRKVLVYHVAGGELMKKGSCKHDRCPDT